VVVSLRLLCARPPWVGWGGVGGGGGGGGRGGGGGGGGGVKTEPLTGARGGGGRLPIGEH
jgi:hypothetical protein